MFLTKLFGISTRKGENYSYYVYKKNSFRNFQKSHIFNKIIIWNFSQVPRKVTIICRFVKNLILINYERTFCLMNFLIVGSTNSLCFPHISVPEKCQTTIEQISMILHKNTKFFCLSRIFSNEYQIWK